MTLPRLCAALALSLVACADDGPGTTPASAPQTDPSTAATDPSAGSSSSASTPPTTPTEDAGSASMSASEGTSNATPPGPTTDAETTDIGTSTPPGTTGSSSGVDPDTTAPGSSSGDPDTTTGTGEKGTVRFVVLGDTGEGNEDQYSVAAAIVDVCAMKGCDFGMLTGDNFYDSGVSGTDDPQWQDKFELPYADITFPMYAVLGNHDYGGGGIGIDFDTNKPDYQVEYTDISELWRMPATYYNFKLQHVDFWGLDTNQIMTDPFNGNSELQQNWFDQGVAGSTAAWKIAFGHHPYISNGDHGNAGDYENLEGIPLDFVTGENVKDFMESSVCGKIDVYICGHDHNIQWLEPKCGTEFIVSGAGSKSEGLPGVNAAFFGLPEMEGFLWVEIVDDSFTGEFYDKTGAMVFTRTLMK